GEPAMNHRTTALLLCLGGVVCGGLLGCGSAPNGGGETKKPPYKFIYPRYDKGVQDYVEYTGRTAAEKAVDVKARVTGPMKDDYNRGEKQEGKWIKKWEEGKWIKKWKEGKWIKEGKEGKRVKKGEPLFRIDPAPYQAQLEQAEAQARLAEKQVEN